MDPAHARTPPTHSPPPGLGARAWITRGWAPPLPPPDFCTRRRLVQGSRAGRPNPGPSLSLSSSSVLSPSLSHHPGEPASERRSQVATGERRWRGTGDGRRPPIGGDAAEVRRRESGSKGGGDGGPCRRLRGAGGREAGSGRPGSGGQRRRGGRPRPAPAPPRARRPPVHLHPRQAHQGARPPRVGAGAELRPAAAVQAVRQPLRRARGPARDRQPPRGQRQDRPAGDNQHREARAARRRRAHTRRQVRRRRPPPPELLIHNNSPPREH